MDNVSCREVKPLGNSLLNAKEYSIIEHGLESACTLTPSLVSAVQRRQGKNTHTKKGY